jgi:peptidoglycan/LPS O-acetylase OafA/YrhL
MNPISPIPVVLAFLLALATTRFLATRFVVILPIGRVSTIDGLRGYLGFAVFLHHASIWFFFLRTGQWAVPPSNLYTHLGQSGVALFFMITGFLFFSKLIDSKERPVDWTQLYISRIFRLTPLYLFAMVAMFSIVAILSNGQLREPVESLALGVAHWLAFTLIGGPDLNGLAQTSIIMAGVTWTLPYEWVFYLMLPLFALLVTSRPPIGYLVVGVSAVIAFKWLFHLDLLFMKAFIGGMAASVLVRYESVRIFSSSKIATMLVVGCVATAVVIYPTAYGAMPLLLLSIAFTLVAGGCTLFGLFINHTSRVLGEMAFSIYLLHGILLFLVFRFLLGFPAAGKLTAIEHWMVIALCTPVLILISFLTFRRIELPAMRIAPKAAHWIKSLTNRDCKQGCNLHGCGGCQGSCRLK